MTDAAPNDQGDGVLLAIATRPTDGNPMTLTETANIIAGRGIDTENRKQGTREITLMCEWAWKRTCEQLSADLPWTTRRANLFTKGFNLPATIGKTIAIGDVIIKVHDESRPCGLMDEQHAGLREALKPESRGGVCGEVLSGGTIHVGDTVSLLT